MRFRSFTGGMGREFGRVHSAVYCFHMLKGAEGGVSEEEIQDAEMRRQLGRSLGGQHGGEGRGRVTDPEHDLRLQQNQTDMSLDEAVQRAIQKTSAEPGMPMEEILRRAREETSTPRETKRTMSSSGRSSSQGQSGGGGGSQGGGGGRGRSSQMAGQSTFIGLPTTTAFTGNRVDGDGGDTNPPRRDWLDRTADGAGRVVTNALGTIIGLTVVDWIREARERRKAAQSVADQRRTA